jgi:hypothetical protein
LSLTLKEEHRQTLFENGVHWKTVWPERDEVTRECRWLYNELLHDLYSAPNIIHIMKSRRKSQERHVAHIGDRRGA